MKTIIFLIMRMRLNKPFLKLFMCLCFIVGTLIFTVLFAFLNAETVYGLPAILTIENPRIEKLSISQNDKTNNKKCPVTSVDVYINDDLAMQLKSDFDLKGNGFFEKTLRGNKITYSYVSPSCRIVEVQLPTQSLVLIQKKVKNFLAVRNEGGTL